MEPELVDLVVVGAGWYGLAAAKTYREINPLRCVVVLEQASTLGGAWARHSLSPGLHTEHRVGSYEYSDFPLDPADFGLAPGQRIPGDMIQGYLNKYVDRFHLRDLICFNSRVVTVEHCADGSWMITMVRTGKNNHEAATLRTAKLIIATGPISEPPLTATFSGRENFKCPLLDVRDLPHHGESILQPGSEAVTVFGGTWSARETVSLCASSGRPVDWIVPEPECVPVAMALSDATRWSGILQYLLTTRFLSLLSPCIWGEGNWLASVRDFLHRNWAGQLVAKAFWRLSKWSVQKSMSASKIENPWLESARARVDPYWMGIPDPNPVLCDLIREGVVRIHVGDILRLGPQKIHLSTDVTLASAGLIYDAGHASSRIQFLPDFGIWSGIDMTKDASQEILRQFPVLRSRERWDSVGEKSDKKRNNSPRLTRLMVPPSMVQARSIVFLGSVLPTHAPLVASTQALWAAVYLSGKLDLRPTVRCPEELRTQICEHSGTTNSPCFAHNNLEDFEWEAVLHTEFEKVRYAKIPPEEGGDRTLQYDVLPYLGLLIKDLGLKPRRKSGIWGELWSSYTPTDYRELMAEWKEKDCNRGTERKGSIAEVAKSETQ